MAAAAAQRHPILAQLDYALTRSPLPIKIEQPRDGSAKPRATDRLAVFIPCCLELLKWEVLYNLEYPSLPPDFIFGPDDEEFQPLAPSDDESAIPKGAWPILRDWNVSDPSRLLRLILELRSLYLKYQRSRVEAVEDPQVRFEINTMAGTEGLEMRLVSGSDKADEVLISFPVLNVDMRRFPRLLGTVPDLMISLQARYALHGGAAPPQLRLIAPIELKEVFDVDDVKLPGWPDRTCLMEYFPFVQELLKIQIQEAFDSVNLRRHFMEALAPYFGRPLEAETALFRRVTVLASSGIFTFLVHLALPINFPKQQPALTFQSSQHFDRGKPIISRPYTDYPWSPRWDVNQMAQRIYDFVVEECLTFKKQCG